MLRNTLKNAPATTAITALCTLVFLVTAIQARSITDVIWASSVGERAVLFGPMIFEWGYLRTLSAGFVHIDITHLALNMFMLSLIHI